MDGLAIEQGDVGALAEVQALIRRCGNGPVWPADAWERLVGESLEPGQEDLLLLARAKDGMLCGWLAASRIWDQSDLEFVLVDTAWRGRGVAGLLLERWIAWARAREVAELMLEVRVSNGAARGLYRALGFVEQGQRRGYYQGPVEDAVLMGRRL